MPRYNFLSLFRLFLSLITHSGSFALLILSFSSIELAKSSLAEQNWDTGGDLDSHPGWPALTNLKSWFGVNFQVF